MTLSKDHKITIVVAIIMLALLVWVNIFRNGTAW